LNVEVLEDDYNLQVLETSVRFTNQKQRGYAALPLKAFRGPFKILEKVFERLSEQNNNGMVLRALSPLAKASSTSRILFGVGTKECFNVFH